MSKMYWTNFSMKLFCNICKSFLTEKAIHGKWLEKKIMPTLCVTCSLSQQGAKLTTHEAILQPIQKGPGELGSRQNCSHMLSPVGCYGCDPITTWEHAQKHNLTHLAANSAKIQCSHDMIIPPTTNQCNSWMSSNKEGKTNGKLILLIFNISHLTLIHKTSICLWNIHTLIRRRCLWVLQPVKNGKCDEAMRHWVGELGADGREGSLSVH